jgi:hypothetical protein
MKFRIAIGIAFVFCLASAWAERPGNFRVIGPGGGGAMFNPTISPHDPNTVLVSCDMTGSYITHDGGRSWRMFNLRGVVNFFVFDPIDSKTMYAHATGLWRSTDGGERWELVDPNPSAVKGVKMNSDHADEQILADPDPLTEIAALAVDPSDSKTLYAAAGKKESPALFISHDYGKSWQQQVSLPEVPRRLWVDPNSATDGRTLFLASAHAIAVVSRGGVRSLPLPATVSDISMGFGSVQQPTLYVTSEQGIYVSSDAGVNWRKSGLPGGGAKVRAIATSLHHPETAYVSYDHLRADGESWIGVAKTINSGTDWKLVWRHCHE